MKTLQAQRLKKQAEGEYQRRDEMREEILEEAWAELEKLGSLLADSGEMILSDTGRQVFEECREDDQTVYFEQGILEW